MASLLVKVASSGPDPAYQDGDVIAAFSDHRALCVHAQHLCDHRREAKTAEGLCPTGGLGFALQARTYQYRFDRVSRTEVRRTDRATGAQDVLGPAPTAAGEAIDVPRYLARARAHPAHRIFGLAGRETWFGGQIDFSPRAMADVWGEIEARTARRRADHREWPFGEEEMRCHLVLPVDDFLESVRTELESPTMSDAPEPQMLTRRAHAVEWRTLGLPVAEANVLDPGKKVDVRNLAPFARAAIVRHRHKVI